jgi:outer membrane protein assembly factor BamB
MRRPGAGATGVALLAAGLLAAGLLAGAAQAQPDAAPVRALRTPPLERFTVNARVRDWGPATIAGQTLLAGGPSGDGGLFAVDLATGRLRWTYRPGSLSGSVSSRPAVWRDVAIAPFGAANPGAVIGVSIATGRELWRGPDPAVNAAVAVHEGLAYALGKDGGLHALDAATGREVWKVAYSSRRAQCASQPIVRDGVLYLTATADPSPDDARSGGDLLFALDAKTGEERWRYRAHVPDAFSAACLRQPVVTADTIFATGGTRLYAVDRATGRDRWAAIEVRRPVEGRDRGVEVHGLVDAGPVLVGLTGGLLIAFDKATGQTAWEIPGRYGPSRPSTAVADGVLYFQGSPATAPAAQSRGTLHALDLATRAVLWSFSRPTAERDWAFGAVTPVDAGLWVDSYGAMVKLQ